VKASRVKKEPKEILYTCDHSASDHELMFVPRLFVQCPISLPRRHHVMQAAIPVGVPSLSFGFLDGFRYSSHGRALQIYGLSALFVQYDTTDKNRNRR
jgi:hypothetical protein